MKKLLVLTLILINIGCFETTENLQVSYKLSNGIKGSCYIYKEQAILLRSGDTIDLCNWMYTSKDVKCPVIAIVDSVINTNL